MLLAADIVDHQAEFPDDLYDGLGDDGELRPLFAAAQALWETNRELLRPRQLIMADIRRLNRTVDSFTDDESCNSFRFRHGDLHRLIACLDLPPAVRCSNGIKFS